MMEWMMVCTLLLQMVISTNGKGTHLKCDKDVVMAGIVNVHWENVPDRRRMHFTFSNSVPPVYSTDIQAVLGGKTVLFLGNSNMRRVFFTVLYSGNALSSDSSNSSMFSSNNPHSSKIKKHHSGENPTDVVAGEKWEFSYVSDPDITSYFTPNSFNCQARVRFPRHLSYGMCNLMHSGVLSDIEWGGKSKLETCGKSISCLMDPTSGPERAHDRPRMMYQYTGTPGNDTELLYVNSMAEKDGYLDAVVIQMNEDSAWRSLLVAIKKVHSSQEGPQKTTFYLMDTVATKGKEESAMSNYLRNKNLVAALPNVYYVPTLLGEFHGIDTGLLHTLDSSWHYTMAGMHFHSQALLAMMRCTENGKPGAAGN